MKTLEQLQGMGLASKVKQLCPYGDSVGYKVLRYNALIGQYSFTNEVYSQQEIENQDFQDQIFGSFEE